MGFDADLIREAIAECGHVEAAMDYIVSRSAPSASASTGSHRRAGQWASPGPRPPSRCGLWRFAQAHCSGCSIEAALRHLMIRRRQQSYRKRALVGRIVPRHHRHWHHHHQPCPRSRCGSRAAPAPARKSAASSSSAAASSAASSAAQAVPQRPQTSSDNRSSNVL